MNINHHLASYKRYPNLEQVLKPEYAALSPAEIEALMEGMFGSGAAEYYEEYLEGIFGGIGKAFSSAARDVGRFAAKAAPAVAAVGGGALQGALAGAPLGLPGIIAGAAAGGTGAALSRYGKGTARKIGGALSGVTGLAGQFSPAGRAGGAIGAGISSLAGGKGDRQVAGAALNTLGGLLGGSRGGAAVSALGGLLGRGKGGTNTSLGALTSLFGGAGAAGQLMSFLQRPETMQALAALNLGSLGRPSIPVGRAKTPVPTAAFANTISELVEQTVVEAAALSDGAESELRYMLDEAGEFIGDPALDRDRAARIWELLNEAQAERLLNVLAVDEQISEVYEDAYEDAYDENFSENFGEYLAEVFGENYSDSYGDYVDEDYSELNVSEYYERDY